MHQEEDNNQNSFIEEFKTVLWLWKELVILAIAVTVGVLSFKFNAVLGDDPTGLFGRSGSMLVLLAAVNEYLLRTLRDRQLDYLESKFIGNSPYEIRKMFKPKVSLGQKIVTMLTHLLVIVGTVIWGFGDLFV